MYYSLDMNFKHCLLYIIGLIIQYRVAYQVSTIHVVSLEN